MRNFLTLWRRELSAYFISPIAYVTMVLVLVVTGAGFGLQANLSRGELLRLDVLLFWLPTLWMMVLIVATVSTMRLFAEEKRSGTLESLMTAPVTEVEVVLGKYAAALTLYVVTFAPTVCYIWVLRRFSSGVDAADMGPLIAGYVIVLLIGGFYIAVGLLMSALARSQVVAAIGTFAVLCIVFLLAGALSHMARDRTLIALHYMSAFEHIADFSRGVIDTRPIVFYVSCIAWTLFATVKVIESRRWL